MTLFKLTQVTNCPNRYGRNSTVILEVTEVQLGTHRDLSLNILITKYFLDFNPKNLLQC